MASSSEYTALDDPDADIVEQEYNPKRDLARARSAFAFTIVTVFLVIILSLGIIHQTGDLSELGVLGPEDVGMSQSRTSAYCAINHGSRC